MDHKPLSHNMQKLSEHLFVKGKNQHKIIAHSHAQY